MVADLHAVTVPHDPARLRARTREVAAVALAAGVDPAGATLFVQSQVPAHRLLHYLLEAVAKVGEAQRMVQFKEKSRAGAGDGTRLALLTYPVLMAADILLYDVAAVPVGDDQDQHLQLARTLAHRANRLYGAGLVVPEAVRPEVGPRLMDLQDPTRKMEKTNPSHAGVLFVLDPPDVLARKVSRAVTDTEQGAGLRAVRPGGQARRRDPARPARGLHRCGPGLRGAGPRLLPRAEGGGHRDGGGDAATGAGEVRRDRLGRSASRPGARRGRRARAAPRRAGGRPGRGGDGSASLTAAVRCGRGRRRARSSGSW